MNHHYADMVHREKMATYYAEAAGSRLAEQKNRLTLRAAISRLVMALVRHQSPSTGVITVKR
jgi:hypothetical protein